MLSDRGPCLFELLDTNRDKHLGVRELRDAWKNLAAWDANKDGAISKDEVPRLLQVTISCGRPARLGAIDGIEGGLEPAEKERQAGPLWFRKMDVNGDGDVSRREWLGTEEDFRRIDTDGDGLIDAQEAAMADWWIRKRLSSLMGLKIRK
jgi:Ca2+-binding EF-hand superfamily protein